MPLPQHTPHEHLLPTAEGAFTTTTREPTTETRVSNTTGTADAAHLPIAEEAHEEPETERPSTSTEPPTEAPNRADADGVDANAPRVPVVEGRAPDADVPRVPVVEGRAPDADAPRVPGMKGDVASSVRAYNVLPPFFGRRVDSDDSHLPTAEGAFDSTKGKIPEMRSKTRGKAGAWRRPDDSHLPAAEGVDDDKPDSKRLSTGAEAPDEALEGADTDRVVEKPDAGAVSHSAQDNPAESQADAPRLPGVEGRALVGAAPRVPGVEDDVTTTPRVSNDSDPSLGGRLAPKIESVPAPEPEPEPLPTSDPEPLPEGESPYDVAAYEAPPYDTALPTSNEGYDEEATSVGPSNTSDYHNTYGVVDASHGYPVAVNPNATQYYISSEVPIAAEYPNTAKVHDAGESYSHFVINGSDYSIVADSDSETTIQVYPATRTANLTS